jgi:hypothetical protein
VTYLLVGGFALLIVVPLAVLIGLVLRNADNETRFYSLALGILLSVVGGLMLFAFAAGPPEFGNEGAPGPSTPLRTPLATPAIATPVATP